MRLKLADALLKLRDRDLSSSQRNGWHRLSLIRIWRVSRLHWRQELSMIRQVSPLSHLSISKNSPRHWAKSQGRSSRWTRQEQASWERTVIKNRRMSQDVLLACHRWETTVAEAIAVLPCQQHANKHSPYHFQCRDHTVKNAWPASRTLSPRRNLWSKLKPSNS